MRFCEKCGALMLPHRVDGKVVLKCRECGHEQRVRKKDANYRVEQRIKHSPREKIVFIENEERRIEEISEDELRERRKAILEYFEMEDTD